MIRFFQSKIQFPKASKEVLSFFAFLITSSYVNFLLCETIYFFPLHSADHLYNPLLIKDLRLGNGIGHWYFPPSPYFFPDGVLVFLLSFFLPFLYLPTGFGVFQMALVYMGMYLVFKRVLTFKHTLSFLIFFQILITTFSLLGYFLNDTPLPFVYFFSNAHHSTGFFFSLFLVSLYVSSKKNEDRKTSSFDTKHRFHFVFPLILYGIGFALLYLSDRYSFWIGFFCFLLIRRYQKKETVWKEIRTTKGIILFSSFLLFLILLELTFYWMKTKLQIPNSFFLLHHSLSPKTGSEILYLSTTYLYDFGKQIFFQNHTLFFLILLSSLTFSQFPSRIRRLLFVLIPVLLILLVIVGRFTYLHPFPIRYLFPLWFFCFLGITFAFLNHRNQIPNWIGFLFLLFCMVSLSILPKGRTQIKERISRETKPQVSYTWEKPIRFWTEGKETPIPVDASGKPYHWITGAFHTP